MIPDSNLGVLDEPTTGYVQHCMINDTRIHKTCDGVEALKQSIYKLLSTDRYAYAIYSDQYGISISNLIGQDKEYAASVLEMEIEDALSTDDRIVRVGDFSTEFGRDSVHITFAVSSIYGDFNIESEVELGV